MYSCLTICFHHNNLLLTEMTSIILLIHKLIKKHRRPLFMTPHALYSYQSSMLMLGMAEGGGSLAELPPCLKTAGRADADVPGPQGLNAR